jgi:hypothetical protein
MLATKQADYEVVFPIITIPSVPPTGWKLKNYPAEEFFSTAKPFLSGLYKIVSCDNIERDCLLFDKDLEKTSLEGELLDYLNLPNGWDGYEGVPPKRQTIGDAIRFVKKLPKSIPLPKPMLGGSGVVGLYWDKQDIYADVCFAGDGTFWYYAKDAKGNKVGEDEVHLNNQLPVPLLNIISVLTH